MVGYPKSTVVLCVYSDIIEAYMPEYLQNNSVTDRSSKKSGAYHFLFPINIRECIRGEIYISEENICLPCPTNKYSLNASDKTCKPCPRNAFCEGRDKIIVNHGYWRSSVNSVNIYQCNQVSDPCLGGHESLCKVG